MTGTLGFERRRWTRSIRNTVIVLFGVTALPAAAAFAQIDEAELKRELVRVPASSPGESRAQTELIPGFELQLVAAEPLIRDPVALEFDEFGRLFVIELPAYNGYAVEEYSAGGRILRLEDRDGDGSFETRTVFADELRYPTAIACWGDGLFVGDAPDLMYLRDADGDGVAETREVWFTGFGSDRAGEAHLNSIRWGLDNRFHLSTNLSGGEVRSVVEGAESSPVSVRGRGFIFDPRRPGSFELTSGGGQHGMSRNDWGHKFVCSNSVPAQVLMYDDRYLVRNPQLQANAAAVDIAPEGKFTRLFRISPPEPWRRLRTRLRSEGRFRGSDEGGKPFGFFTGATGITVYRGDAWPEEYRGNLFVGDVANNLVYRARLESDGIRWVARRADEGREFLASRDIWFRPVQFAHGPDGNLYVIDMYRELIEGAAFLPPEFFKYVNVVGGNERGRIYRIAHKSGPEWDASRLPGRLSVEELVARLDHADGWQRDTAARLLSARQSREAVPLLERLAAEGRSSAGRATAMWMLRGLEALSVELIRRGLGDESPEVRVQALQLAEAEAGDSPVLRQAMLELVDDAELAVRYQLAFSLGSFHSPRRPQALAKLLLADGEREWQRLAVFSSLQRDADVVFRQLLEAEVWKRPQGEDVLRGLVEQIGRRGKAHELAAVVRGLSGLAGDRGELTERLLERLLSVVPADRREELSLDGDGLSGVLSGLLKRSRETLLDGEASIEQRAEAARSLGLAAYADVADVLPGLLTVDTPAEIQAAVLQTLANYSDAAVGRLVIGVWPELTPALKAQAAETLFARLSWLEMFLEALRTKQVALADVDPARLRLLRSHPDAGVRKRVEALQLDSRLGRRDAVIDKFRGALEQEGDAERGRMVFMKNCSACHRLEGQGTEVGADLKAIRNRGLEAVLFNILDPNREVKPQYLSYVVVLQDGRVLTGMIRQESANSIQLRRPDGTEVTVARTDIDEMRSTGQSFMPEGLEQQISVSQMADLLAYLDSIR